MKRSRKPKPLVRRRQAKPPLGRVGQELVALIWLALAGLGVLALSGRAGTVGGPLQHGLRWATGETAWGVPASLGVGGLALLLQRSWIPTGPRRAGLLLFWMVAAAAFHWPIPSGQAFARAALGEGGGMLGALLAVALKWAVGPWGGLWVLGASLLAAILLLSQQPLGGVVQALVTWVVGLVSASVRALFHFLFERVDENVPKPVSPSLAEGPTEPRARDAMAEPAASIAPPTEVISPLPDPQSLPLAADPQPVQHAARVVEPVPAPPVDATATESGYVLPPLTLLGKGRGSHLRPVENHAQRAQLLEQTLANFGIQARVSGVDTGPAVTRYEVQPASGVKVSRIVSLADDIALALAATDVRIVAPIPGKAAVGIEVPNRTIRTVYLRELMESEAFRTSASRLTLALGEDITGQPVVAPLEKMLHLLIAGSTGSGKSVCINTILISLLFKARPDEVKLLLIDPKLVELSNYNGIPHLLAPVVTDPKKAAVALKWAVKEMTERYEHFANWGVRDITRFNEAAAAKGKRQLPYIVIVIDELADLMLVAAREVEDAIQRLAQMARAAGIHLIVATQRPSVDVITGIIKANIPSRISFAVSSQADSRTILDGGGAEKLLGKGDMLFYPIGASKPMRAQGALVTEHELEQVLAFVRGQVEGKPSASRSGNPETNATETPLQFEVAEEDESGGEGEEDPLFVEALRIVVDTKQASVSQLQRRLRVGFTRAGRLVDMMERRGFVGPHQGSKAREVLITRDLFEKLYGA